ncbi:lisH domain-containing protein C1711.05-like isoform X2 [Dendronephthya gigantea]|nr:lisH domain-containing protein C1711.05-like isoform X2 [Dendronephthya gigantea]
MRKRKVTLINSGDKRNIFVNTRKVVVGSARQSTAPKDEDNSNTHWPCAMMDSIDFYEPKKQKVQSDCRILSLGGKQTSTGKDQRIFTIDEEKGNKENASLLEVDTDVRIVLDENNENSTAVDDEVNKHIEVIEIEDDVELENASEINGSDEVVEVIGNNETEEVEVQKESGPVRKIEIGNTEKSDEIDDADTKEDSNEEMDDVEGREGEVREIEEGEDEIIDDLGGEEKTEKTETEKEVKEFEKDKIVHQNEQEGNKEKQCVKETENPKSERKEESNNKILKAPEKANAGKEQKKSHDNGSESDSSGSESDSSRSGSSSSSSGSSSYSSSSSSSRTSSDSRSSSDSNSDSDDQKTSKHSKHSSRSSSHSSSYSYSTGGSVEKNTMRSVVSQKNKERRSRSPRDLPHRSPHQSLRGRRLPPERRYSDRKRSYDRDDRYRRNRYRDDRRDVNPRHLQRISPRNRLGRRSSSPLYRRRNRSRERERDTRLSKPQERPRGRRSRSKSHEKKKDFASDKNNLSRTDDDFVEIDVKQKPGSSEGNKESIFKKSERLGENREVNTSVDTSGFDLRSRLGPKKNDTKLIITRKSQVDARLRIGPRSRGISENVEQKKNKENRREVIEEKEDDDENEEEENGDDEEETPRKFVVEVHNDREAELDAKILRIQRMNEEIRKRQEEIEREKMMYA